MMDVEAQECGDDERSLLWTLPGNRHELRVLLKNGL